MQISRLFTDCAGSPYDTVKFGTTSSEIRNPDGSIVFRQDDIEVPRAWSQVACDVLAQKYFRKAGVPTALKPLDEPGIPSISAVRYRIRRRWKASLQSSERRERTARSRFLTGLRERGHIGDTKAGTLTVRPMRPRFSTKSGTCWRNRWPLRTRRNGSIPVCTGPMG